MARLSRRCERRLSTSSGLKPRLAFGPVRAAVTGSRISPPLFESIELLGRQSTLARIAAALTELGQPEFAGSGQAGGTAPDIRAGQCEIVTKQKQPSVPARTVSKARNRSGNPAVRAGQAESVVAGESAQSRIAPSRRQPPKPAPATGTDERRATAGRRHVSADSAR